MLLTPRRTIDEAGTDDDDHGAFDAEDFVNCGHRIVISELDTIDDDDDELDAIEDAERARPQGKRPSVIRAIEERRHELSIDDGTPDDSTLSGDVGE